MRTRAVALVGTMWVVTGVGIGGALFGTRDFGHPTAAAELVVMVQMLWVLTFVFAIFLRGTVAPAEIRAAGRVGGDVAARARADALQEGVWYVLGIAPFVALVALELTGWPLGAAVMWVLSLAAMLALVPDPARFEELASRA